MKIVLGIDDFSVVNNRFLWLLALRDHFVNFKISLFTVPIDEKKDWGPYQIRDEYLKEIKNNLDWIELIPHGLYHNSGQEMARTTRKEFKDVLSKVEVAFERDELSYIKGFKAPHWRWNEDVVKVLDEEGWWGAIDRDKKMPCPKKFYQYNYLLNEPFWESKEEVLKLHGHIYGTKNDIGRCFENLLKLPRNTEWHFVTDFLEDKNETI